MPIADPILVHTTRPKSSSRDKGHREDRVFLETTNDASESSETAPTPQSIRPVISTASDVSTHIPLWRRRQSDQLSDNDNEVGTPSRKRRRLDRSSSYASSSSSPARSETVTFGGSSIYDSDSDLDDDAILRGDPGEDAWDRTDMDVDVKIDVDCFGDEDANVDAIPPSSQVSSGSRHLVISPRMNARRSMLSSKPGFVQGDVRRHLNHAHPNPLLTSLVTSAQTDIRRFHVPDAEDLSPAQASIFDSSTYCVPFIGVYSNAAKRGQGYRAAVATQEGTIELIDMRPREMFASQDQRVSIYAHRNSVFDVAWSQDDSRLASSSGDQTSGIFDTETQTRLATLHAHGLSVKATHWHPTDPDLLMSCSRDGDIHGWDLRAGFGASRSKSTSSTGGDGPLKPVLSIYQAHSDTPGAKRRASTKAATAGLRSVTSVNYLPARGNLVLSSGSSDGVLRIWDLRYTTPSGRKRKTPGVIKQYFDESRDLTMYNSTPSSSGSGLVDSEWLGRSRAILDVAVHPTGSVAWALGKNGSVYTYHIDPSGLFTSGADPHLDLGPQSREQEKRRPTLTRSASSSSLFDITPSSSQQTTSSQSSDSTAIARPQTRSQLSSYLAPPLSHATALQTKTFFPRLALSPDGAFLAAGSSTGNVLLWDTARLLGMKGERGATHISGGPVVLGGASMQEMGGVDWGYDSLLTCSDDGGVRVWRRDPERAKECRAEQARDPSKRVPFGAYGYAVL